MGLTCNYVTRRLKLLNNLGIDLISNTFSLALKPKVRFAILFGLYPKLIQSASSRSTIYRYFLELLKRVSVNSSTKMNSFYLSSVLSS